MVEMYRKGRLYKFQLKRENIVYTGEVLKEDDHLVSILTIRGEEVVISKADIYQSKLWERTDEG